MTHDPVSRVPAGVPTGGQFAASAKSEAGVDLSATLGDHYPGCTRSAGHNGPCEPNAYTDPKSFFPPAPLTAHDVEVLAEYKGTFEDGYDSDKVNRVFMRLESAHLMCVWDRHDDYGYGGGSEFFGHAVEDYEVSQGQFSTRGVGSYRDIHPDVWDYLTDPDCDIDPEAIPSLLADEVTQAGDPERDLLDLDGDGFRNLAVETVSDNDDNEGKPCRSPRCNETLTGEFSEEGGYCARCATLAEDHHMGYHRTHIASDSGSDDDCPTCIAEGDARDLSRPDSDFTGSGWGTHRPTEPVTSIDQVRVGDVLADADLNGHRNLLRITSVDTDRGIMHGVFADPTDTDEMRRGDDRDQAVWDFNLKNGEYFFTDIRGAE